MSMDARTMRTARVLPYSPAAIYEAFALPALLAQWWGPEGFTNTFEIFEFKVDGRWVFAMHGPDSQSYANESVFAALEPNSQIVIEHVCAPLFTLAVQLNAVANGTEVSWTQVFADIETAQAVKHIVEPANEQNLDRLTRVLSSVQ